MLDINSDNIDSFFDNAPYLVSIGNRQIMADPRDKGEPGDIVIVWPKKRAPYPYPPMVGGALPSCLRSSETG